MHHIIPGVLLIAVVVIVEVFGCLVVFNDLSVVLWGCGQWLFRTSWVGIILYFTTYIIALRLRPTEDGVARRRARWITLIGIITIPGVAAFSFWDVVLIALNAFT